MRKVLDTIESKPWLRRLLQTAGLGLLCAFQAWQLHASAVGRFGQFLTLGKSVLLLNFALLLWVNLAAKSILQKWHLALLVTSILTTLWSIANVYVVKFHGSPLFFSEFANFGTAMNVLDSYRLGWESKFPGLLLLFLGQLAASLPFWLPTVRKGPFFRLPRFLRTLGALAALTLGLWLLLFVWQKPKPRTTISWTWREGVGNYGYAAVIVEDVDRSIHYIVRPEGYDAAVLADLTVPAAETPAVLPDIVLIINESFSDLSYYLDFTTDQDPMAAFYGIDGAIYGRAVVPNVGGGTNNTEFEVLTGNSMRLLTMYAPFNYVNLNGDETAAPRYLKALGYTSAALHCEPASNYSRNRAYPAMGFDRVVMGNENFLCRNYGERRNLDEDNYQDMLRVSEELGDGPRLLYLLTFQNHGGWETNDASFDTVHVQEDFGDLTDDLDEYLTSVRLSCEAFRALTEQLAASERPTVVLMMGDHTPSILEKLPPRAGTSEEETELLLRTVPYVLWANFPLEAGTETDWAADVDLLPMLYRAAGLPTSAYQNEILALHEALPVRTANDLYRDREGRVGWLAGSTYEDLPARYFALEYNALRRSGDYRRELYLCPAE